MNLILIEDIDFTGENVVSVTDRRFLHIRDVHRARPGDRLRVGHIQGLIGEGEIIAMDEQKCQLRVAFHEAPPPPLPIKIFLALPRPKFLKRVIQEICSLGIKEIHLMNSARVEKVYWSCAQLTSQSLGEYLRLGLEQSRDTVLPRVYQHPLFKPFVEDELPALISGHQAFVAHPAATDACPRGVVGSVALAIGPEGGFVPYEIEKLHTAGFQPVTMGPRILRVETAVTALISRLS